MVAYPSKSDASEGFNQILNFLNGSSIKYALTVNPNIYVSYVKQFWNIVVVKHVNDVTRLQALVDKKKVVVTEAAIREVLRLDDAEGVDCLPNDEIFTELARMGYEKPSTKLMFYKALPSTKLTFYKAFFSSHLVRNVDSTSKFYMYPRFLQLIIRKQVSDLSTHTTKYTSLALTQKVFVNMRRVGKGFSGVETLLFEGMLVDQEVDEEGDADEHVEEVNASDAAQGDDSAAHGEVQPPSPQPQPQPQPQQAANFPTTQALEITKLKKRVKKLEKRNKVRVLKLKRMQRVGTSHRVDTSDDTVMDDASNQGRMISEMDKDNVVVLMDDKQEDKKVEEAKVDDSAQDQGRQAESQAEIYKIDIDHANKVLSMQEDKLTKVHEVVEVVTTAKLIYEVTAASDPITAASTTITAAAQVPAVTITSAPARVAVAPSRRRKGVVIKDPESESTTSTIIPTETKSKDKGKRIMVEMPKPLKKKQQIEMDEQYARELHAELNKDIDWNEAIDHVKRKAKEDLANVAGFKIDYFKRMSYDDIRLIFEAKFNLNVAFLLKTKEQIEEEENRALQKINETPVERIAKRRNLDEEVEDLKRHLKICLIKMMMYTLKPLHLCTCSNLEESKKCIWSSKSQELEAIGIMWCADHNFYNHAADFVSGKEVPTLKMYSRPDAECCYNDAVKTKLRLLMSSAAVESRKKK
nr:xylulose kinase-1 [Tanacetum cinerariifolium]